MDEVDPANGVLVSAQGLLMAAAGPQEWDRPRDPDRTLRRTVEHVAKPWYAEQVGDLRHPGTSDG
jgi:hypothetical protein